MEKLYFSRKSFDLILFCGVDYLLTDHRVQVKHAFSALKHGWLLYFEKSVFLHNRFLEELHWFDPERIFGSNPILNDWFSTTPYKQSVRIANFLEEVC